MKNKDSKKLIINISLVIVIFLGINILLNHLEYSAYNITTNRKINALFNLIKEDYPEVKESEILNILLKEEDNSLINKYSYKLKNSYIKENNQINNTFLFLKILVLGIFLLLIFLLIIIYKRKEEREIKKLINSLENINQGIYNINLSDISEDNLSILKEEIYKTMIMLKTMAENSLNDKIKLKNSLEDISHQLKTPLTSIYITLDNIIDTPKMGVKMRNMLLNKIKRDLTNINFLVRLC